MGRIHHEYHIDAPPEVAWAVGLDANRMPEWNTTTVSVKDVSGPLDRQGATYTTVSKIVGRPLEVQWQVEQVDPGRMAEVTASSPEAGVPALSSATNPMVRARRSAPISTTSCRWGSSATLRTSSSGSGR